MNISEFERGKPIETHKKIKLLEKLILAEQQKTELLYSNRVATLDKMLVSVRDLLDTFKRGD
jgi:hypothetical protein